ncbi:hypothetical protein KQI68_07655 [Peptoniphilus sp. MSJ-1]|uniref:Uncharacterized protein n=1 Tax=Peptoniphilus ovalis TaxID=2841503 RepID=A0ABS6FJM7_9FIRM|nr:hypothetical protein [Peptoniphilus ovalis]MBU5669707.1 hypothetical protein [Peptoniphilus ovalis]
MNLNKILKLVIYAAIFAAMSLMLADESKMILRFLYSVVLVAAGTYFVKTLKDN